MSDFYQHGQITTLHDLGAASESALEQALIRSTAHYPLGLVLPLTPQDMQAPPFRQICNELAGAPFLDTIVVVLNRTDRIEDFLETASLLKPLGPRARILWLDGPRVQQVVRTLLEADFPVSVPGKGLAVWFAFGFLLAEPRLKAFVLHDCDIINYRRTILARLCLPLAHASLDFDFSKAYYARRTDRMHGRVVRLLVYPLLRALLSVLGDDDFLLFLQDFRYPLAGEFAITATLARSLRVPSDWGLEVGTLAEVFRNTSPKRVCQVDVGIPYEHKHQALSLDDPTQGLMRMASDIVISIVRTLASRGMAFSPGHFLSIRAAYLRAAQDAIRKYHADALINGLEYDRHEEEQAIEGFARQIAAAGQAFFEDPSGGEAIANWTRVVSALPQVPQQLRAAAAEDWAEFGG